MIWSCPDCGYTKTTADHVVAAFHPCHPTPRPAREQPNFEEMTFDERLDWYLTMYVQTGLEQVS